MHPHRNPHAHRGMSGMLRACTCRRQHVAVPPPTRGARSGDTHSRRPHAESDQSKRGSCGPPARRRTDTSAQPRTRGPPETKKQSRAGTLPTARADTCVWGTPKAPTQLWKRSADATLRAHAVHTHLPATLTQQPPRPAAKPRAAARREEGCQTPPPCAPHRAWLLHQARPWERTRPAHPTHRRARGRPRGNLMYLGSGGGNALHAPRTPHSTGPHRRYAARQKHTWQLASTP